MLEIFQSLPTLTPIRYQPEFPLEKNGVLVKANISRLELGTPCLKKNGVSYQDIVLQNCFPEIEI